MIKNTDTMRDEVYIMLDALFSIKNEVSQEYSSERYLAEKLEKIEYCLNYLKSCIKEKENDCQKD